MIDRPQDTHPRMTTASDPHLPAEVDREGTETELLAIDAESIRVTYPARHKQPARHAVRGVTLRIPPGQRAGLLGPNGSGKSTLFRTICGRLIPDNGHVRLLNRDLDAVGIEAPGSVRGALGVVFQDDSLDPFFSVRDNLLQHARFFGLEPKLAQRRIHEILGQSGLADRRDAPVRTLSQGLARRVDLCRALLHEPEILLLDEPTVGLDPGARRAFHDLLDHLHETRNLTVLMSTHLTDEAARQDRVILMHEGEIVADGSPSELRHEVGHRILAVLSEGGSDPASASWSPEPDQRPSWRYRRGVWARAIDQLSAAEIAQITLPLIETGVAFTVAPATLEDVFLQRTGRSLREAAERETEPPIDDREKTDRSDRTDPGASTA